MGELLQEVEEEAKELLTELIRIDTSNPPGKEAKAAEFLAHELERDGLDCEVLESEPERGNLITRIEGSGEGPSLLLLSHLDVVPAKAEEWSVPPFSGLIKDGYIWGRGALDCKGLVTAEAMVMKLVKREGVRLRGDLIFAATADEEMGGRRGVGWLVERHLPKIKADYVINEGGGFSIPMGERHIFTVQTAEKGVMWLRIRAKGRPGHGSVPGFADNAVQRMATVIRTLERHRSRIRATPTVRRFIEGLTTERGMLQRLLSRLLLTPLLADWILDRMAERDKGMAESLRAMLRNTMTATIIHGGIKENIIPSECEAVFDCRVLPGETKDTLLTEIKRVLSRAGIELEKLEFEFIQADEPSESPMETPLYSLIEETLRRLSPNYGVVPMMVTGGTDSRYLRRVGSICYGFSPFRSEGPLSEIMKMVHGVDERISIRNLIFSVSVLYELVKGLLT
jgi:acetylornithine deacetylase/succinyl-diaminopimelate desuccinylase-like protein